MSVDCARPWTFFGVTAALFAASAAVTIAWCTAMADMGGMLMPGGWTMSMAWMRMPGQTWPGAAAAFLGMWLVMMMAMMLPSLVPMLWRYRRAVGAMGGARVGGLTLLAGTGYFFIWTVFGLIAFIGGVLLAEMIMRIPLLSRAVPFAVGMVVMLAGASQFTAWKSRQLACCRGEHPAGRTLPTTAVTAWCHGMQLGLRCSYCCAGLTAVLLVIGVMDLRAMGMVTLAITAERLLPHGERIARLIGAAFFGAGILSMGRAVGLG